MSALCAGAAALTMSNSVWVFHQRITVHLYLLRSTQRCEKSCNGKTEVKTYGLPEKEIQQITILLRSADFSPLCPGKIVRELLKFGDQINARANHCFRNLSKWDVSHR